MTVMQATFNGQVIASSDKTVVVEGNHYFPPDSVRWQHFTETDTSSVCPWKGTAGYFTVEADGKTDPDAAWIYREPKDAAANIKDHVAFWRDVVVSTAD
jgi:uncharacterized protein (DUF427 family)